MGNSYSVNTDGIESARPGWSDIGYRINGALSKFFSVQSRTGACWGSNDPYGKAFYAQYGGPADQVLSTAESAAPAAENTADGLGTMAKGFASTEENNRASIVSPDSGPGKGGSGGRSPGSTDG